MTTSTRASAKDICRAPTTRIATHDGAASAEAAMRRHSLSPSDNREKSQAQRVKTQFHSGVF